MLLSDLPPDVLAQMATYCDQLSLFSLWLTGSLPIRTKLGKFGAWNRLEWSTREIYPLINAWPRWLLPQLPGLETLRIRPFTSAGYWPLLRPTAQDLGNLPFGLLDLELDFVDGFSDIHLASLPRNLTRLALPRNTMITQEGLSSLPTTIQDLRLQCNQHIQDSNKLPRTLLAFYGNTGSLRDTDENLNGLPPMLTELNLESDENYDSPGWKLVSLVALRDTLPHLQSLSLITNTSTFASQSPSFPPQLTYLRLVGSKGILPHTSLPHLPTSLKTLAISSRVKMMTGWDDSSIGKLPRGLTTLMLRATIPLSTDCFALLPPTLTKLILPRILPSSDDSKPLPQLLWNEVTFEGAQLPNSLTHLEIVPAGYSSFVTSTWDKLPPNIRRLNAQINFRPENPPRFPSCYPESLSIGFGESYAPATSLVFVSRRETSKEPMEKWIEQSGMLPRAKYLSIQTSSSSIFEFLGPHLVWLAILANHLDITTDQIRSLPRSLTYLQLRTSTTLTDECVSALPPELQHLELPMENLINGDVYQWPVKLHTLITTSCPLPPRVPLLPPFLTRLSLLSPNVTDVAILGLPRHITNLEVSQGKLTGKCVSSLPRNITQLNTPNLEIFDADVPNLPRSLINFNASKGSTSLSDASIHDFPPTLQVIALAEAKFTKEGINRFPKSIHSLFIGTTVIERPGGR